VGRRQFYFKKNKMDDLRETAQNDKLIAIPFEGLDNSPWVSGRKDERFMTVLKYKGQ